MKNKFICIEDLNVSEMMKMRHLSGVIGNQGFCEFKLQIEFKSEQLIILSTWRECYNQNSVA